MASVFTKKVKRLKAEKLLTGTVSVPAGTLNLVGVGTLFTTELTANDYVWLGDNTLAQINTITDATHATLKAIITAGITAGAFIKKTDNFLYQVPGATLAIIHSLFVSNNNDTDYRKFIMRIQDSVSSDWMIFPRIEIPVENGYSHPKPINLEAGDKFHIVAVDGVDSDVHVYASIVQKT